MKERERDRETQRERQRDMHELKIGGSKRINYYNVELSGFINLRQKISKLILLQILVKFFLVNLIYLFIDLLEALPQRPIFE